MAASHLPPPNAWNETSDPELTAALHKADQIHDQNNINEAIAFLNELKSKYPECSKILVKRSRWQAEIGGLKEKGSDEQKALFKLAEADAVAAIAKEPNDFAAHKALAVAYGKLAGIEGMSEKIRYSKLVKDEAEKALELNPNDSASLHILGLWHYNVANLGFIAHAFLKVVYGGMPEASNEKAVECFRKAYEIEECAPHHLELAKVYLAMKKKTEAKQELDRTLAIQVMIPADARAQDEAREILKKEKL